MMYGLALSWFARWIYTDSDLTAMIHSRSLWGFLPQVAQVKTRRRRTKNVSGIPRVACTASIILSFTIWAVSTLILTFRRNILSLQYILSRIIAPIYKVNAKLAIGQLQLVMSAPIGGHYLISDVTNVVRLRV